VTTDAKSNVMAKMSGEITEVFTEEGKDVNEGDTLISLNPLESNLQLGQIQAQVQVINNRIALLNRAEKDATNGKNTFNKNNSDEVEFYNKLANLSTKRKEFIVDKEAAKKQGATEEQIVQYEKSQNAKDDVARYEGILQFTNEKKQLEFEKSKLEAQKKSLEKAAEEFKIIAPKSGKLHLNAPLNKGMVLQAGSLIGTLTNKEEKIIIESLIPSNERPRIHVGDEVSLAVAGLSQSEYGTIEGKVSSIDEDATIDNQKGNVFFKVKIQPEKTYLTDKKGEKVNLSLGMLAETRVKYEKITYMKYFLDQMGIKLD
ncbi:MAG: HlyD family secretion protein, partial [Clostridium sp.]